MEHRSLGKVYKVDLKKVSLHLSKILDNLGYSQEIIQYRIAVYRKLGELSSDKNVTKIYAGSKGEGLTKPFESDIDILGIVTSVICYESGFPIDKTCIPKKLTAFQLKPTLPGYTTLRLESDGSPILSKIYKSLVLNQATHDWFLSSSKYRKLRHENERNDGEEMTDLSGVACAMVIQRQPIDTVQAIPCMVPYILQQWQDRERIYDWPPLELRHRIPQMNANLVAKGFKGSPFEEFEWRICFNEIELLLTQSLNLTHLKLYTLLKMVKKDILKPRGKEITSFIMKNITWWLAENHPTRKFQEKYLMHWLMKGMQLLKQHLEANFLPYYMIPGRNLLAKNMTEQQRVKMLKKVHVFLAWGPLSLLELKPLKRVSYMPYGDLCAFSYKRDELEMVRLSMRVRQEELQKQGLFGKELEKDKTWSQMHERLHKLVVAPWPRHLRRKLNKADDFIHKLEIILK